MLIQVSKERIDKLEVDNTSLTAEVDDLKNFYMWEMEKLQEVRFLIPAAFLSKIYQEILIWEVD